MHNNLYVFAQTLENSIKKEMNWFYKLWENVDWHALALNAALVLLKIILTIIVFYAINRIGRSLIRMLFKQRLSKNLVQPERIRTVRNLTLNTFRGVLIFGFIYTVLSILSIPVGSLLAGAGIVGLAISFGAQGLVADITNGISILLENQLDINDHIVIGEIEGTVQNINLKTTQIRDFDGTLHYIPNREILTLSNKSKGAMRVRISICLKSSRDWDHARQIIQQVNEEYIPQCPEIVTPPKNILFNVTPSNQLLIIVDMFTTPGDQFVIQSKFSELYIDTMTDEGIVLPVNPLVFDKK